LIFLDSGFRRNDGEAMPGALLVGAVADPKESCLFKGAVGRATPSISLGALRPSKGAPANRMCFSACGLA
jgi:hypothetical protein